MNLDKNQLEAVTTPYHNVLVVAGSGSGKTATLLARVIYLLENGANPSGIFAITYTNAAAFEMKRRLGANGDNVFVGTIHSLANKILRENGVSTSEYIAEEDFDEFFEQVKKPGIELPIVEHLLIDEFQDICENEYRFIFRTLNPMNYFCVGDSQQAIYSFKGGNFQYFMDMANDPFNHLYVLENNYRSGKKIIEFAETLIENVEDVMKIHGVCKRGVSGYVSQQPFSTDVILDELCTNGPYGDWFILARTNNEVSQISSLLENARIPYTTFKKADVSSDELNARLKSNVVKILTIHTAKGLESKKVMVLGTHNWNNEERRVSYVAATRAQDELIWFTPVRGLRKKAGIIDDGMIEFGTAPKSKKKYPIKSEMLLEDITTGEMKTTSPVDFSHKPHPLMTPGDQRVRSALASYFNSIFEKGVERGDFDYEMEEEWSGIVPTYPAPLV